MSAWMWMCVLVAMLAGSATTQEGAARAQKIYAQAVDLEEHARYADALPLLWEAAQLAPGAAEIQNRLGEALERIGALDAAADAYRRAITSAGSGTSSGTNTSTSDKTFRKATNNLILVLAKGGKTTEALTLARAEVAAAPGDADRLFTLGLAQAEYNLDDAIDTFRRVLATAPRHTLARYNLALTLKRADRPADAAAELTRLIEIEPRPEAQYQLGVIAWQQGQFDRAAAALRAAIAARPEYADAHYTLGAVLKAKGDPTAAATALRRAITLNPTSSGAHYVLAQVLRQIGEEQAARKELAESERLRQAFEAEHEASVLTFLGIQKLDAGDPAAAAKLFTQATTTFEPYAPAHYQLGRALQRLQKPTEATAAFTRARQLNPALVPPPEPR